MGWDGGLRVSFNFVEGRNIFGVENYMFEDVGSG